ncbi:MAG: chromate transporter [Clostridia bacterium]|nr:chromate transporter [Clostridia bacterium]
MIHDLLLLFWEFFKTGLFATGGGMATLPFLYEMADKYPWFTRADLADMIAISESTPGPIGINMSTYAGFQVAGVLGGLVATLALVLPSIIIIILISKALEKFRDSKLVKDAFYGLRPAVMGMIGAAAWQVIQITLLHLGDTPVNFLSYFNWPALALFAVIMTGIYTLKKVHPVVFIAFAAVIGIIFKF